MAIQMKSVITTKMEGDAKTHALTEMKVRDLSILTDEPVERGGTGSSIAAPIAKKIIKKVIDRHQLRKKYQQDLFQEV